MGRTPPGQTRERVFRFVRDRLLAGLPPTIREVRDHFGFRAVQTAREHLEALVADGRLDKRPGRSRGYRLPDDGRGEGPPTLIPLLGRVQAGALAAAIEDPDGYIPARAPRSARSGASAAAGLFALRVRGESMRDAGILPGDVVVVRQQPAADDGDVVVALVDDEATVKRLRLRRRRVELHPANPDFRPIVPRAGEEVRLLGKVIEVRRFLEGGPEGRFREDG